MAWQPHEHSDQDNLQWSWLRAVEWGRWPIFLSQPIVPVLLIWFPWQPVVIATLLINIAWALFARYKFVSVPAARFGASFVRAKWVFWPAATAYMLFVGRHPECWVALAWPFLIFPLGVFTPTSIGRIQTEFMRSLGYQPSSLNPLSSND